MLYHFELQMAGVILLTAMVICGISIWWKRRRARILEDANKGYRGMETVSSDYNSSTGTTTTTPNDKILDKNKPDNDDEEEKTPLA